jgi:hypothetical protein
MFITITKFKVVRHIIDLLDLCDAIIAVAISSITYSLFLYKGIGP